MSAWPPMWLSKLKTRSPRGLVSSAPPPAETLLALSVTARRARVQREQKRAFALTHEV